MLGFFRSVTCPRFANGSYTEIMYKTSARNKTHAHNVKRKGRLLKLNSYS